jgi:hypothetical protein
LKRNAINRVLHISTQPAELTQDDRHILHLVQNLDNVSFEKMPLSLFQELLKSIIRRVRHDLFIVFTHLSQIVYTIWRMCRSQNIVLCRCLSSERSMMMKIAIIGVCLIFRNLGVCYYSEFECDHGISDHSDFQSNGCNTCLANYIFDFSEDISNRIFIWCFYYIVLESTL